MGAGAQMRNEEYESASWVGGKRRSTGGWRRRSTVGPRAQARNDERGSASWVRGASVEAQVGGAGDRQWGLGRRQ